MKRMFITELMGKEVRTADGTMLGIFDDAVFDTATGEIKHILLTQCTNECRSMRCDHKGRKIADIDSMSADGAVTIQIHRS